MKFSDKIIDVKKSGHKSNQTMPFPPVSKYFYNSFLFT